MKDLYEELKKISYPDDDFYPSELLGKVQKAMDGYEVGIFDCDDYNQPDLCGAIVNFISSLTEDKVIEDIQTEEWCPDDESCYFQFVAVKTKE